MQSNTMDENATIQAILSTAKIALAMRPVMDDLVTPFASLFCRRAQCAAHMDAHVDDLAKDMGEARKRFLSGVPILASLPATYWKESLKTAWTCMLPAIKEAFPGIAADIVALTAACEQGSLPIVDLAAGYIDGSFRGYESTAHATGISPDGLGFVMRMVLPAALEPLTPHIEAQIKNISWSRGYCPICGSLPVIGMLSRPSTLSGEFLKESGGQKFLHCGACGHNWRFDRHACPICDNSEPDTRFYLSDPDYPSERVDICRKCGHYLLTIDLRERDGYPHLDTAAICMVHLDILAQKHGFKPLSPAMSWSQADSIDH